MRIVRTENAYVVRLDRGESILEALTDFVKQEGIKGGSIVGLGAVKNTVLGYLDPRTKVYLKKTFPEDMELVNLTANISWVDGVPFVHAHATISGEDFLAYSGHLFSAEIAVTGEIFVTVHDVALHRVLDPSTGARLIGD